MRTFYSLLAFFLTPAGAGSFSFLACALFSLDLIDFSIFLYEIVKLTIYIDKSVIKIILLYNLFVKCTRVLSVKPSNKVYLLWFGSPIYYFTVSVFDDQFEKLYQTL